MDDLLIYRRERYCNWHNGNRPKNTEVGSDNSGHAGLVQVLAELVTNVNNP
ncbi:hypothetical protein DL89DRAFT_269816 [Linderina pennispora]|uniref:Uncharacterized protein n=1 Tax=Linderina pennispora TaxID=61395 RepID=A0A1Y1VZU7_9FUNG|nr:uncharacterized protein DL89DRAFT_269816 [Linderina pennispora]ORX66772.1 hypothetical protein DL89DRAFT_269816 [Linderina pennispora]